jgi:SAM-dependent methyltransferase
MRVLDVGANTGMLLDFAQEAGCLTTGLEYSDSSLSILRDKGHAAHSSITEAGSGYDVITAFDLVEHLYDVPGFLQSCHERLTDGGRLVMLTGDIEAPSARLAAEHWWYLQYPEHIVFPSRTYLGSLPLFRLQSMHRTYASVGYQRTSLLGLAQMLRKRLQGQHYNGLPSLGPDHMLVVLEKALSNA